MLTKLEQGVRRFMYGRYGLDNLNRFLSVVTLALCVAALVSRWPPFNYTALALILVSVFRTLSRNTVRRQLENQRYLRMRVAARRTAGLWVARVTQAKTHRFFKCPTCGSTLRVPKTAKGRISITCPKCGKAFERKVG
jgi:uncharacterized C2H2 Zn-finger protein